ncbi:uncharacterized protein F5891DRAFT_975774 [Suillus fuscotomentosus]|uniref:BCNT-C domain-containing protein n=1 Tax=Suillus fuscotomentosus TaxID=1912939 RepID=A0AAD4EHS5_9AGAM|nr:uncharacterized protein F5891DRAFT_975774 [Suillus fuscotomentosus]KAG1906382.1 hypothetical protein F5891DRAFT_975774 [Suillus fuscotomentosus]
MNVTNEVKEEDLVEKKKAHDALWASFQASVATPPSPKGRISLCLVMSREVVEVPEDLEEVKKWPRWDPLGLPSSAASAPDSVFNRRCECIGIEKLPHGNLQVLASLASLVDIPTQKAKKITTLDKSAMDWCTHVTSSDVKDER